MASNTHRLGMLVAPTPVHILPSYDPEAVAERAYGIIVQQQLDIKRLKAELESNQVINKSQIELISEINDYLNINELTSVGSRSIFHKQCQDILKASRKVA